MIAERILSSAKGVIHVGAGTGKERHWYGDRGLRVVWIEADPDTHEKFLDSSLPTKSHQIVICYLIGHLEGEPYEFKVASDPDRSSIFEFTGSEKEVFPNLETVTSKRLIATKLDKLWHWFDAIPVINAPACDALVIDVNGAALMVLGGATETLKRMRFVQVHNWASSFYRGAASITNIVAELTQQGFKRIPYGPGLSADELFFERTG